MKTETKIHTRTPWKRDGRLLISPDLHMGQPMSLLGLDAEGMAVMFEEADAEFVITAANCHDELKATLAGMLENYIELKQISLAMARSDAPNWVGAWMTPDDDIHVQRARAILAKAK